MKRVIIATITILGLIATGCSKNERTQPSQDQSTKHPKSNQRDGGGDDDRIIIIHRVENSSGAAINNASISYTNAGNTAGGVTDNAGDCVTTIPYSGTWDFSITRSGYLPKYAQVNISDTTVRKDTLYSE